MAFSSDAASPADGAKQKLWDKVQSLIVQFRPEDSESLDPKKSEKLREIFIKNVWPSIREDYGFMTNQLETRLKSGLKDQSIDAEVSSRVKEVDSIEKTLQRRENDLKRSDSKDNKGGFRNLEHIFSEMHDLSGLRIVLKYREDLDKAQTFINCAFDQRKAPVHFDPNRKVGRFWTSPWFQAYETHNHRLELPIAAEDNRPVLPEYAGVMFEIQLTTFADNLYNKLAHDLLYKASPGLLNSQDEMVVDLSHGVARCFELCMTMLKGRIDGTSANKQVDKGEETSESLEMTKTLGPRQAKEALAAVDDFKRDFDTLPAPEKTSIVESLSQLVAKQLRYVASKLRLSSSTIPKY